MQNLSSWPPRARAELQGGSKEGGCFSRCGFTSRSTPQYHFHPMLCSLCSTSAGTKIHVPFPASRSWSGFGDAPYLPQVPAKTSAWFTSR